MATIIQKFKLYGPKHFIIFSFIEIGRIFNRFLLKTYSQNQEDLIIERILKRKVSSYIDIGSNHPVKFNNTYRFYLTGSRGINIEPNLSLIKNSKLLRPKDKNLQIGIAKNKSISTFYQLDPDVDSTFSQSQANDKVKQGCRLVDKYQVKIYTLKQIFQQYFNHKNLDLLSIDTEGYDLQILQSNDWDKYRPKILCIEDNSLETQQLLTKNLYTLREITVNNSIYFDEKN
ncbi:MAG: FkbM family methyltransferase [Candidatus Shapirobacteria bacterium]